MTFNQSPKAQLSVMQGMFAEYIAKSLFPISASEMSKEFFNRLPQPGYGQNQMGRFFYNNLESVAKEFGRCVTANIGPSGKRSKVTIQ